MKRKIKIPTILKYAAFVGVTYAAVASGFNYIWNRNYYDSKDFDKAEWVKVDNSDGKIWDDYKRTGIKHNIPNWRLYQEQVKKKNDGKLEGDILVPKFE